MRHWLLWWAVGILAIVAIQVLVIELWFGRVVSGAVGGVAGAVWGFGWVRFVRRSRERRETERR